MFPFESRLTCQQSSMLTYSYPASFMPDLTIASAMLRIISSLTLQANLFHEFQPMGGGRARVLDMALLSWLSNEPTETNTPSVTKKTNLVFMRIFVPAKKSRTKPQGHR